MSHVTAAKTVSLPTSVLSSWGRPVYQYVYSQSYTARQPNSQWLNDRITDTIDVLQQWGRKVHQVTGGGNCYFRTISFFLFGKEDYHDHVQTLLFRFENLNVQAFEGTLIPGINESTLEAHVRKLCRPFTGATHTELMATATVFGIPVYFCTQAPVWFLQMVSSPTNAAVQLPPSVALLRRSPSHCTVTTPFWDLRFHTCRTTTMTVWCLWLEKQVPIPGWLISCSAVRKRPSFPEGPKKAQEEEKSRKAISRLPTRVKSKCKGQNDTNMGSKG